MIGRRRIVILLVLTSILLLTIDLRGNTGFDYLRSGFRVVMTPFETVAQVVTRPIINVWRSVVSYDDILEENRLLRDQIDAQRGAEIAARSALVENQQLRALNALESLADLPSVTAAVIGGSPSNNDQVIEIDRGSIHGVQVGMAVANEAGLVGKVTRVFRESSFVMLITDPRYAVEVKIMSYQDPSETGITPSTVPSGLELDELEEAITAPPEPPLDPSGGAGDSTDTSGIDEPEPLPPLAERLTPEQIAVLEILAAEQGITLEQLLALVGDPSLVEQLADELVDEAIRGPEDQIRVQRETGAMIGQGPIRLPQVDFVLTSPTLSEIRVGDAVLTAGGRVSLAPPDIPIGVVANIIARPGAGGSQLEVRPAADLRRLQFVRIIFYKPPVEVAP
jgi:rod shape-determining protein MreC